MEIEDKWIVSAAAIKWPELGASAKKVKHLEQGYLKDAPKSKIYIAENALHCVGQKTVIDNPETLRELQEFIAGGNLDASEVRYRKATNKAGDFGYVMTIKGKGTRARFEAEFPISDELGRSLAAADVCAGKIVKDRYVVADGNGVLEIDRYFEPVFLFASIEREFASEAEAAAYKLPEAFGSKGAVKVTDRKEFKNKNLAVNAPEADAVARDVLKPYNMLAHLIKSGGLRRE